MKRCKLSVLFVVVGAVSILAFLATGAGAAANKVKLTYMSWYTAESEMTEMAVAAAFMAKNPDIEVEKIAGDPRSRLPVMVAGGAPPDVAIIDAAKWSQLEVLAVDITAAVRREGISISDFLPGSEPNAIRNGRWYGLPWGNGGFYLLYNRDHFAEAGLPPISSRGWTSDAFLQAAKRLTITPAGASAPARYGIDPGFLQAYEPFVYAAGGRVIDDTTGWLAVDKPEYYNMLQFYADLFNVHRVAVQTPGNGAARRIPFMNGTISMLGDWMSGINAYITGNLHERFSWSYAYWPTQTAEAPGLYSGHTIAVIQGSKQVEAATRFVLFWASREAEHILASKALYPVTRWGIGDMARNLALPAGYRAEDVLAPIITPTSNYHAIPYQIPGFAEALNTVLAPAAKDVFTGKIPAQQAMTEAARLGNALLMAQRNTSR